MTCTTIISVLKRLPLIYLHFPYGLQIHSPPISPYSPQQNKSPSSFTITASVLLKGTAMAVKRTRTSNEIEPTPSAAAAKWAQNQTAAQLPSGIATPSRVKETAYTTNVSNLGHFLKRCKYCKKSIQEGVEVFMYKDFCAYCSVGCRDIQISLDRLAERQAACSTERVIQYQEMKDVRSHCGS